MPNPTHITVTAPPDRVTPIHEDDGTDPGGGQLRVTAAFVDRVRYSQGVRRSIARGDLIPCNMAGAAVPSIDLASAPDGLPDGRIARGPSVTKPLGEAISPTRVADAAKETR